MLLRSSHEDGSPLMATADGLLLIGTESVAAAERSFFSREREVKSESCCSILTSSFSILTSSWAFLASTFNAKSCLSSFCHRKAEMFTHSETLS